MSLEKMDVEIIPANPGFLVVYENDKEIFVVEDDVIAWKIEIYSRITDVTPITTSGTVSDNYIGIINSDGFVTTCDGTYLSVTELIKDKYPDSYPEDKNSAGN